MKRSSMTAALICFLVLAPTTYGAAAPVEALHSSPISWFLGLWQEGIEYVVDLLQSSVSGEEHLAPETSPTPAQEDPTEEPTQELGGMHEPYG